MLDALFFPEVKNLEIEYKAAVEAATVAEDPQGVIQAAAASEGLAVASRKTALILAGVAIIAAVGVAILTRKWGKKMNWLKYILFGLCILVFALGVIMFAVKRAAANKWKEAAEKTQATAQNLLPAAPAAGIPT